MRDTGGGGRVTFQSPRATPQSTAAVRATVSFTRSREQHARQQALHAALRSLDPDGGAPLRVGVTRRARWVTL
jgi:hypothetical protein